MRNQHQHRARPSVVHIACYRLGLLLHQRQGEMRTGFARDHALSGGFLPRAPLAPSTSIVPSAFIWRCLERGPCVRVDLPHLYSWATCYKISSWESNVQTRRQGQTVTSFCVSGPPRLNSWFTHVQRMDRRMDDCRISGTRRSVNCICTCTRFFVHVGKHRYVVMLHKPIHG